MNIKAAYDTWSDSYDSDANLTRDLDSRVTRAGLAHRRFASILEIGCGTGKNTAFLAGIAEQVHSLDFSEGMIAKAREKVTAANVRFETADLNQPWPCNDAAYALILCCLVLEHIADLSHIFAEAARVLQPGGKFFINELHPFKQYRGTQARFEQNGQTIEVDAFVHHISDFLRAAKGNGLRLESLEEHWREEDEGKPPRLISFVFEK
jgi:malonyl-CoA O-methyltransferase